MWDPLKYESDHEMWAITFFIHFPRKYSWQEFCNCTHVQRLEGEMNVTNEENNFKIFFIFLFENLIEGMKSFI